MQQPQVNPFHASRSRMQGGAAVAARGAADIPADEAAATASALFSSKPLADELRRDDAAMAEELAILTTHAGRSYRQSPTPQQADQTLGSTIGTGGGLNSTARTHASTATNTLPLHGTGTVSTDQFLTKKREIGLARMSLATKKAEIRKLDDDVDRAEKRLHQQQEQLENTREKFNNFLKHSNLEQDAAVRRADGETKIKQERMLEIKRLSARINHVETEINKIEQQLESCKSYKSFLDDLTKPQWFTDVLISLRVADKTEDILNSTEAAYTRRAAELTAAHQRAVETREEVAQKGETAAGHYGRGAKKLSNAAARPVGNGVGVTDLEASQLPELVPLEIQLEQLQAEMAAEAQAALATATEVISEEVSALPPEKVRAILHSSYPEERIPMHFSDVNQLLEIFINVEEGNLFLIQNCQELEEELERVAMDFMAEKEEMQNMTKQRHAQMESLAEKTRAVQMKMQQLEQRAAALDSTHGGDDTGNGAAGDERGGRGGGGHLSSTNKQVAAPLTPEQLKVKIEQSIASIFRHLTVGDNAVKAAAKALQTKLEAEAAAASASGAAGGGAFDGTGTGVGPEDGAASLGGTMTAGARKGSATTGAGGRAGAKKEPGTTSTGKKVRFGGSGTTPSPNGTVNPLNTTGGQSKRKSKTNPGQANGKSATGGGGATGSGGGGGAAGSEEPSANIGPVEMLTIIENKLEEYHRFITDPANGVEEALIQAVMKASDKERRRQARVVHLAKQASEHEERSRRALERAEAPVVRRTGKPVHPRSHYVPERDQKEMEASAARRAKAAEEDGAEFFR